MSGLRHGDGEKPEHEYAPLRGVYSSTSNLTHGSYNDDFESGYSDGSSVLQFSGGPVYDSPDAFPPDTGDSAAGYDLKGIGAEVIHNDEPSGRAATMGRLIRQEEPIIPADTHEGIAARGSDYDHPGERGFRYRSKSDGV